MSSRPGFRFDAATSPLFKTRTPDQVGLVSEHQATAALQMDAVARRILAKGIVVADGERVGSRLNINVLRSTGVAVNTVHRGNKGDGYKANRGWWGGEVVGYRHCHESP